MLGDAAQPGVKPDVEVSDTNGLRSESGRFAATTERSGDEPHNRVALCNILSGRCSGVESVRETGRSHDDPQKQGMRSRVRKTFSRKARVVKFSILKIWK